MLGFKLIHVNKRGSVVHVIHLPIFFPGLHYWHRGHQMIVLVSVKQPWRIWLKLAGTKPQQSTTEHTPTLWASCQIRKIAGAHALGMPGTFSPPPQVSDPDMHHVTCVTHVPWCMPGSLTSGFLWSRRVGKTFPAFPAHAQPATLRIW